MQRYFAIDLKDDKLVLKPEDLHHIFNVLRLKNGEHFQVIYGDDLYDCEVKYSGSAGFSHKFLRKIKNFDYTFSLFIANPKGDKLDTILQKCTEIGVSNFYVLETERCIAKMSEEIFLKRETRYKKIIQEAAQQSKQDVIPQIYFIKNVNELKSINLSKKFIAYENENTDSLDKFNSLKTCDSFGFLVGPEGGFSEKEVKLFNSLGFENISLGNSILRCETAPIYIASIISFIKGKNE